MHIPRVNTNMSYFNLFQVNFSIPLKEKHQIVEAEQVKFLKEFLLTS